MFLKSIRLKNFRCFSDLEFSFEEGEFNRKHTLILGQNGTGKSNLLKAIGLVTAGSNALGEILSNPESWIQYGKGFCEISAVITTADKESRVLKLIINRGDYLMEVLSRNKESLSMIDKAITHTDRNYFVIALGASRRLAGKSRSNSLENFYDNRRANNLATLFNREASLNSLENWAIDMDYRHDKKGLDIVRNSLKSFLPGVAFHSINKDTRQLVFKTVDGLITLDLLSDGYQNMASWLGDLLYRVTTAFPERNDPMKARGLILIDEIDLHLHPIWQRNLLAFFRTKLPNFQLVATTHSPITAQQAEKDELYALSREKGKIKLIPFIGNPSKILVNQLLMSPLFGIESDESLNVQKMKKDYTQLTKKINPTEKEQKDIKRLTEKLTAIPIQRTNSLLSSKDKSLLEDIKKAVSKK